MIIGLSGLAGSGKDTAADYLVSRYGFVKVSLADPLKRWAKEAFDFSDEQLWGPSHLRNIPDTRYLRDESPRHDWTSSFSSEEDREYFMCARCGADSRGDVPATCRVFLTPRHALQALGTEWGRSCYKNVWVDYGLRTAKRIMARPSEVVGGVATYRPQRGLWWEFASPEVTIPRGVAIPDCRFENEIKAFREQGAKVFRILRSSAGLSGAASKHLSEVEQLQIPDSHFDAVIDNNGSVDHLYSALDAAVAKTQ